MIKDKNDLQHYIAQDLIRNKIKSGGVKSWILIRLNPRVYFTYNLRYLEYYSNQKQTILVRIKRLWHYYIHKRLSYKLGFTIYPNNFGPGLYIGHYGTIVVNTACRIGANCTINVDVNIGMGGSIIGDNVYISPGVKIIKPVHIGNNVMIGANAVVNKNIPDNVVVAGIPAKIIKDVPDYWKNRIL